VIKPVYEPDDVIGMSWHPARELLELPVVFSGDYRVHLMISERGESGYIPCSSTQEVSIAANETTEVMLTR
jgi:hypothetical protein